MPSIPYGTSSYQRARGDLPTLPVVNMIAEEAPTEQKGLVLQSRPGMEDAGVTMGLGPVKALFRRDGVLGGALYGVSGFGLYRGADYLGEIDGFGAATLAGYETTLFAAMGGRLWSWDGSALAVVPFPDNAFVTSITVGASRLVALRADTGQFYWSDPLSSTIGALSFATAENQPDRLLDLLFLDDALILFGAETVEFWPNTGDPELPFQPLEGRVISKGIRATGCATLYNSAFAWVTNENNVCVSSEENVISNPGLQARIEASVSCALFAFLIEGVEYLALRLDDETQVFSSRSGRWSEFQTKNAGNWLPRCTGGGLFGSAQDGKLIRWGKGHLDMGGVMERRFRAGYPINSGSMPVANVILRCNVGGTPFLSGEWQEPVVEMRTSRDVGKTFGNWRKASLGEQGKYRTKVKWNACGMAAQPGFIAEFRVTDPIDFRVSDVLINEAWGGRG